MENFKEKVQDSGKFQAMVTELAPLFEQPVYSRYFTPRFNETRDWKGLEKVIGSRPMASLIDRHSGKPIIGTEAPAEVRGVLPHFGNMLPISSDELVEIQKLEDYIMRNVEGGNEMLASQLTDQLTETLTGKFGPLATSPLFTMDKLGLEEWSNGTATILAAKNLAGIPYQIDFQVKKYHVPYVWSDTTNGNALKDLDAFAQKVWKDLKIRIDTLSMNPDEIRKMLAQASTKAAITSYITNGANQVKVSGIPSEENVNMVLNGQYKLPSILSVGHTIDILNSDGIGISESFYGFADGRVAATIGTDLGYYMYTLSPEQRMPDNDYNYAVSEGNVLLSSRSKKGNLTLESDLSALPVLSIRKKMAILVTDDTTTGDALY